MRPPVGADDVLLELLGLKVHFRSNRGVVRAVDGVDLTVRRNRTLGIVGESGCGKSALSLAIMGLLARPQAQISGEMRLHRRDGSVVDLAALDPKGRQYRAIRGGEIAIVFQEPMSSLNPVYTIGAQIMEAIRLQERVDKREARRRAIEMLGRVGIPSPEARMREYPYQMSGGMRQRVMIAMALSCRPDLLICDEPTTALDVTIQAQILELMAELQQETRTAIVLITHDLGVVAGMAEEVAVMYLGQIVEKGPVANVFGERSHPYTEGLFRSLPTLEARGKERLRPIPGFVPDPRSVPRGCRFAERCGQRMEGCSESPPMVRVGTAHEVRCWLHAPIDGSRRP